MGDYHYPGSYFHQEGKGGSPQAVDDVQLCRYLWGGYLASLVTLANGYSWGIYPCLSGRSLAELATQSHHRVFHLTKAEAKRTFPSGQLGR